MRIILDIDETKDANNRKAVRLRSKYYRSSGDGLRVYNCGIGIYNLLVEAFLDAFHGGVFENLGEQK